MLSLPETGNGDENIFPGNGAENFFTETGDKKRRPETETKICIFPETRLRRPLNSHSQNKLKVYFACEEYSQLKELDARMHVLKFSTDISKTWSGYTQGNVTTESLNRYFKY